MSEICVEGKIAENYHVSVSADALVKYSAGLAKVKDETQTNPDARDGGRRELANFALDLVQIQNPNVVA